MKHIIKTGTCTAILGFATAALLTAQTTTTPQQQQPPASTATASANKVTLTGCLRAAPSDPQSATTTGTSGTAGATAGATGTAGTTTAGAAGTAASSDPAQQKFVLMDAVKGPAPDPAAAASTAGAAAAAQTTTGSASASKETYRLVANPTALLPHVGKKLELTGTLEDANSASPSTDNTSGAMAGRPVLRVESGRVVGNSCDQ